MSNLVSEQVRRRNELIEDFLYFINLELIKYGLKEEQATQASQDIILNILSNWRGLTVVFPTKPALYMEKQRELILQEFNGRNMMEVVRKYGISENAIYGMIRESRKQAKQKRQEQKEQQNN